MPKPRTLDSGSLGAAQVCGEGRTWKTDGVGTCDPWEEEREPRGAGRQSGLSPGSSSWKSQVGSSNRRTRQPGQWWPGLGPLVRHQPVRKEERVARGLHRAYQHPPPEGGVLPPLGRRAQTGRPPSTVRGASPLEEGRRSGGTWGQPQARPGEVSGPGGRGAAPGWAEAGGCPGPARAAARARQPGASACAAGSWSTAPRAWPA